MSTWMIASIDTLCGGPCRFTVIQAGRPMLVFTGFAKWKVRCERCAGEPAPETIPAHMPAKPVGVPALMTRLGLLPLDFGRQRDPGEEG